MYKLKRPIMDIKGENEIHEVRIKKEEEISAFDFLEMEVSTDGKMRLKDFLSAIASTTELTENQVKSMHPADYTALMGIVGNFLAMPESIEKK